MGLVISDLNWHQDVTHYHFGANASHPHKDSCIPLIHDILGKISEVTSLLYSLCKLAIELTFEKFCIRMCMYSNKKVGIHRSTSFSKVTSLLHSLQMLLKAHRSQSTSFSKHTLLKFVENFPLQVVNVVAGDFWEGCAVTFEKDVLLPTHTHTHIHAPCRGKFSTNLSPFGRIRQAQNTTGCHHFGTINWNSSGISTVPGAPWQQRSSVQIKRD